MHGPHHPTNRVLPRTETAVFRRDDGFERTLLLSPMEQSAGPLRESVQQAFRVVPPRTGSAAVLPPGVNYDRRAAPRR